MYDPFILSTLYDLKKDYGVKVHLTFKVGNPVINSVTGEETFTLDEIIIPRAIRLPLNNKILTHLANVDPNFKFGGEFSFNSQAYILEYKDLRLPNGKMHEVTQDDWLIVETGLKDRYNTFNFLRLNIDTVTESYAAKAYFIITKSVDGEVRNMVSANKIKDTLSFSEQVTGIL